jgi:hypothetical protein
MGYVVATVQLYVNGCRGGIGSEAVCGAVYDGTCVLEYVYCACSGDSEQTVREPCVVDEVGRVGGCPDANETVVC